MRRLFTSLMATLMLMMVAQKASAYEYWIMGDLAQTTGDKWSKTDCRANGLNKLPLFGVSSSGEWSNR